MSQFFDQASLVMVPSGYKDGKLYSQKPLSSSGELTFSRGSDIEATRVASNGYIEKAKVNLLLQSNSFTNAPWETIDSSVTGGQSGYDGSSDARLLENTDAGGYIRQNIILSGVQTLSVYAKAGTLDFIRIRATVSGTNVDAYFDLSTGTYAGTAVGTAIDATITSMGSGWHRCSLTYNETNIDLRIYPAIAYNDLTDTSGNIYIQDAQLNYGLVAQEYQETTTTSVVSGITNDMPRLDYSGGASCPSLLLEPSRTNLVTQSEYIGSLTPERGTITSNADTSPEGVVNATSFVEDSTTGRHRTSFFQSVTSGTTYTFSMFAKIKSGTRLLCINNAATIGARAYFDLVNGDVEGVDSGTASIEAFANGWYRCSVTATSSVTGNATTYFGLEDGTADNGYAGDGTSGHYWYGLQLEAGSYPTSYIPTYGTSATRLADQASKTGISSLIGQTEGTLFVDFKIDGDLNTIRVLCILRGVDTSDFVVVFIENGILYARMRATSGGALINVTKSGFTSGVHKVAIGYAANDLTLYLDGVLVGQNTSASVAFSLPLSIVNIGENASSINQLGDGINQVLIFKTRLTNAQLAELTTL
jgi:hypothetical protein